MIERSGDSITPIFTGGTGRSGTTVLGTLLGKHSQVWATFPRELRFLTDRYGLLDLAIGGTVPSKLPSMIKERLFLNKLNGQWWYRVGPDGHERGLHRGILPKEFERAQQKFKDSKEPTEFRSQYLLGMVHEAAHRHGASMWVDTSPANAMNAQRLTELLPDAMVIHVVRDGRDACASVISRAWGPSDPASALEWWRKRMLLSHRGMSTAPSDKTFSLVLEELLLTNRDDRYKDLLRFLGLDDEEEMHNFFNESMTAERGHIGRWKEDIAPDQRSDFNERYAEIWHELESLGVPLAPLE